jgi:hypothetical protein
MIGAIPLLPLYAFEVWSGTTLPYTTRILTVLCSVKLHIVDHIMTMLRMSIEDGHIVVYEDEK